MKDTAVSYCDRIKVIMIILNDLNDLANAYLWKCHVWAEIDVIEPAIEPSYFHVNICHFETARPAILSQQKSQYDKNRVGIYRSWL